MKCKTVIDKEREEEVLIYAHERNALVEKLEKLVLENPIELFGYSERNVVRLDAEKVEFFSVIGSKVFAYVGKNAFEVRQRLYALEEMLGERFVKINQSCLANANRIARFDASFGGSLKVIFKNGMQDYVSRRQVKCVKERIGI